jgi:DNA-binding transcriptional LysR family regulator
MNLHQLRLFCSVADKGSFSLACPELDMTQPALSIQIKRLEEELGLQLLARTRKGVHLTQAGEALYSSAKVILENVQHAQIRMDEIRKGIKSPIRIAVSPTGVFNFLIDRIKSYLQKYPEANLQLVVDSRSNILSLLAQRRIDLVFEYGPVDERLYRGHRLTHTVFRVACSPHHPCAHMKVFPRKQFLEENYIDLYHGPGVPSYALASLLKAKIYPRVTATLPSIDAIKKAIEANIGVGLLSHLSLSREEQAGILKAIPLEGFRLRREIVVFHLKNEPLLPSVKPFIEFAKQYASNFRNRQIFASEKKIHGK